MNNIQKRWDRHYEQGCATAYFINLESPIFIFDSVADNFIKYANLSVEDQNMLDVAFDDFEDGFNKVVRLGGKIYERLNYNRFSLLREIKQFGETVYQINDFKEG